MANSKPMHDCHLDARRCALDVIDLWEAPSVVRRYLETGDETIMGEAWSAAMYASWHMADDKAELAAFAARNAANATDETADAFWRAVIAADAAKYAADAAKYAISCDSGYAADVANERWRAVDAARRSADAARRAHCTDSRWGEK